MHAEVIDDQLQRIKGDLLSQGLTYEHLQDDILDHICCMVEEDLESGNDFESSYKTTMSEIGDKTLSGLQHQTLLLLDRKFQRMKKITYVLGFAGSILAILGVVFKMMHWPFASILLLLGFMVVILGFLPIYFISSYKEQTEKPKKIFPIVAYLAILLVFTGAVFKIMHWPGSWLVLRIGTVFLLVGFLPLYVVQIFKKTSGKKVNAAYVIMLLVGLTIVFILARVSISKYAIDRMLEITELNEKAIKHCKDGSQAFISSVPDSLKSSKIDKVVAYSDALEEMADQMLNGMLEQVNEADISISEVKGKDKRDAGREAFLENGLAEKFKSSTREFKDLCIESIDDPVLESQIELDLLFADDQWYIGWTAEDDIYEPLVINYTKITEFKRWILQSEYLVLKSLLE